MTLPPPDTIDDAIATGRILGRAEAILGRLKIVVTELETLVEETKSGTNN